MGGLLQLLHSGNEQLARVNDVTITREVVLRGEDRAVAERSQLGIVGRMNDQQRPDLSRDVLRFFVSADAVTMMKRDDVDVDEKIHQSVELSWRHSLPSAGEADDHTRLRRY